MLVLKTESCKNKEGKNYSDLIFSIIILMGILGLNAWFLLVRGKAYIDSDMASNFVAAVFFNSEHTWASKNWYYSTIVGLLADTNVYQFVLLFCKNNWNIARTIGVLIMQGLLVFETIRFALRIKINRGMAVLLAAVTISPLSYWLFLMIGFGAYYIPNAFFALLALNLLFGYIDSENHNKKLIYIASMGIVGAISGINGIKALVFPYGPLVLTAALFAYFTFRKNPEEIKNKNANAWKFAVGSIISMISFGIGFIVNMLVIAKVFVVESHDNMSWAPFNLTNVFDGMSDCFALLGYQNDEHLNWLMNGRMSRSVFSLQGIANLFGIVLIFCLIVSVCRLIGRYEGLSDVNKLILLLFISSLAVGVVIFKFTEGYTTSPAYWVPLYPIMLIIMAIERNTETFTFEASKQVALIMVLVCVLVTSFSTIKLYQESPLYANPQLENVAKWLKDNGYEKGYATFWQSNAVTYLTDGNIEMWSVYGFDSLELNKWLQKKSHENNPEGDRIFALIGPNDELDREVFLQYMDTRHGNPEIVYSDDEGYIVVEYK